MKKKYDSYLTNNMFIINNMLLLPLFMSHKVNFISNFNEMSCIMIILFSKYNIKLEIEGKLFISFVFEK